MLGERCAFPHTLGEDKRGGSRLRREDRSGCPSRVNRLRPSALLHCSLPTSHLATGKSPMQRLCRLLFVNLLVYLILPAAAMAQIVVGPGPGGPPDVQLIEPGGTQTIPV